MAMSNLKYPWPSAAKRVRPAKHQPVTRCELFFEDIQHPGSGFSFPCDAHGNTNDAWLTPTQKINYQACREDTHRFRKPPTIRKFAVTEFSHGAVECECGHVHDLAAHITACSECGQLFNPVGQLLLPQTQWKDLP